MRQLVHHFINASPCPLKSYSAVVLPTDKSVQRECLSIKDECPSEITDQNAQKDNHECDGDTMPSKHTLSLISIHHIFVVLHTVVRRE